MKARCSLTKLRNPSGLRCMGTVFTSKFTSMHGFRHVIYKHAWVRYGISVTEPSEPLGENIPECFETASSLALARARLSDNGNRAARWQVFGFGMPSPLPWKALSAASEVPLEAKKGLCLRMRVLGRRRYTKTATPCACVRTLM